jgi:hypothetical protein
VIGTAGDYSMGEDGHWSGPNPTVVQALELGYPADSDRWLAGRPGTVQALCAAAHEQGWPLTLPLDVYPELPPGTIS